MTKGSCAKTSWTFIPHDSLSPFRSRQGSQDRVCAVPFACPQHVHRPALQDSAQASTELLIIFLCQTFVSNFISKEVVYIPLGSV